MANKKRKTAASSRDPEPAETELPDFVSNEAMSLYRVLTRKTAIRERGIANEPPFDEYITMHGWGSFCKQPGDANMTMSSEFYANFKYRGEDNVVICRGKKVAISPAIINQYYNLQADDNAYAEFDELERSTGVDTATGKMVGIWPEVLREITKEEISLDDIIPDDKWGSIDKKFLTVDSNVWYSFVAARLNPVSINSDVKWQRIRLLYALKKNIAINVGQQIFNSMADTSSGWGFHSLVTSLCQRAGCADKMNDLWKSPMKILKLKDFQRRPTADVKASTEPDIGARLARMEKDICFLKKQGEHSAKIIAHAFPLSLLAVGPYPVEEEQRTVERNEDENSSERPTSNDNDKTAPNSPEQPAPEHGNTPVPVVNKDVEEGTSIAPLENQVLDQENSAAGAEDGQ